MFCSKCSQQLPDNSVACWKCGTVTTQKTRVSKSVENNNSGSSIGIIVKVVLSVGILGVVAIFGSIAAAIIWKNLNANVANLEPNDPITAPISIGQSPPESKRTRRSRSTTAENEDINPEEIIVDDSFPVKASHYNYYKFTLDKTSNVTGRVEATGGSNDIDTIVVDEDEFINKKNTGRYKTYFQSGYTTISKLDLNLSKGVYYVIFDNSKAIATNKIVKARIVVR